MGTTLVISRHKLRRRPVIQIGHGMAGDMTQLAKSGSKVFDSIDLPSSAITKVWDTNWLWRIMRRTTNARSLRDTLTDLGVGLVHQAPFHNGGNDVHHTMLALLRIMLTVSPPRNWAQEAKPSEFLSWSSPSFGPGLDLAPTSRIAALHAKFNMTSPTVSDQYFLVEYNLISSPPCRTIRTNGKFCQSVLVPLKALKTVWSCCGCKITQPGHSTWN
ncbi:hypothetical protein N7523_005934 [Penicillium sp. IBT 18751x]|nr:hypothetical protein N7523_005934 [Penicillium sp. IBT 18751x]